MSGPQGSDPEPWQQWPGQDQPRATRRNAAAGVAAADAAAEQTGRAAAGLAAARLHRRSSTRSTSSPPAAAVQPPQQYPHGRAVRPAAAAAAARSRQYGHPQYGQQYESAGPVRPAAGPVRPAAGPVRPVSGQYGQRRAPRRVRSGRWRHRRRHRRARRVIVGVVLVLGFWKPGFFVTTKLDVNAAQTGVKQILTDETNGYGAKNVKDVKCNDGQSPTVKKGDTFNCEVSIDGTKRQVTVTFQDDNGTYEVGRPK